MKCIYYKCNANVPPSNKSNGKQMYMPFHSAGLHKPATFCWLHCP